MAKKHSLADVPSEDLGTWIVAAEQRWGPDCAPVKMYRQELRRRDREAAQGEGPMIIPKDGPDTQILTVEEAAQVLEVDPADVRRVLHHGGVSPATQAGGRPLVQRGQLREIRRLLEGKGKRARKDPVPFPGTGLVRRKPAED